jgi:hypothetical protein
MQTTKVVSRTLLLTAAEVIEMINDYLTTKGIAGKFPSATANITMKTDGSMQVNVVKEEAF